MCQSVPNVKNLLFSAVAAFTLFTADAQDSASLTPPNYFHLLGLYDAPVSYGLNISRDFLLRPKSAQSYLPGRTQNKRWVLTADLAAYRYPDNYEAVMLFGGAGFRLTHPNGSCSDLLIHAGLLRTFYEGIVYGLDANGQIRELSAFGRFYALTGISYARHWDINPKAKRRVLLSVRPLLWTQYPYNSFLKLHLSLLAGISLPTKRTL
jgi:hypothetical protein